MGNCPVVYNCTHRFEYVCDWDCIPSDYRWTQNDFDYHQAWDKLYKHCKYYQQHRDYDYCDYCTVNCDKVYQIFLQERESWTHYPKSDSCYDLKLPDGNRLRLNRIYKYKVHDIKFSHKCINCDCNVGYTLDEYGGGFEELDSFKLNTRYMFCYDCYIQKQADFTCNVGYHYHGYGLTSHCSQLDDCDIDARDLVVCDDFDCYIAYDRYENLLNDYYSTKTPECNSVSTFNINDFLSGNLLIKRE